jgi:hypothetical protein
MLNKIIYSTSALNVFMNGSTPCQDSFTAGHLDFSQTLLEQEDLIVLFTFTNHLIEYAKLCYITLKFDKVYIEFIIVSHSMHKENGKQPPKTLEKCLPPLDYQLNIE